MSACGMAEKGNEERARKHLIILQTAVLVTTAFGVDSIPYWSAPDKLLDRTAQESRPTAPRHANGAESQVANEGHSGERAA
jgi:hypothetical protein